MLLLFHVEHKSTNKPFLVCRDHAVSGEEFYVTSDSDEKLLKTQVTFSDSELQLYYDTPNYISHADQKKTFFDRVYFTARLFAQYRKLRLVFKYKSSVPTLLDFGAGVGHFVRASRRQGWQAKGVEVNLKARQIADSKSPNTVFPLNYLDSLAPKSQSVITLWHVLEHLPNPNQQVKQLKKLLHLEGRLIIAVPNFKSYDAKYFGAHWAAYDVPRHLWHFSKTSISDLFEKHDMIVESTHPMWLDAFYVSFLSTKYKFNSMKLLRGFLVGLLSNLKAIKTGEFSSLIYVVKHKKN